jgi:hypothetical protein
MTGNEMALMANIAVDMQDKEVNDILDQIRAEILDNAFSVVNPKNTYEFINVIDLDGIDKILDKYKTEKRE